MFQLQDTLNEEDEVLIVETTEQPLTPDSLAELEKEGRLSRGSGRPLMMQVDGSSNFIFGHNT